MTTFRCHDADACAFGQKTCPTPRACGCEAPAAMPTDRELLELAAKAAGLREWGWMGGTLTHVVDNQFVFWDPLSDDGDALRLAVRLGLRHGTDGQSVYPCIECWKPIYNIPYVSEPVGQDPFAATRRAIVRAAAAIGAALP